jgi:hypothetical protein
LINNQILRLSSKALGWDLRESKAIPAQQNLLLSYGFFAIKQSKSEAEPNHSKAVKERLAWLFSLT